MKILSFAIIPEFINANLDKFVNSLEIVGYTKKHFTIGKMIRSNSKSTEMSMEVQEQTDPQRFNMQGKLCRVSPDYNQIIIHENYAQSGGLTNSNIQTLHDELEFIIAKINDSIYEKLQKCTMHCLVKASDFDLQKISIVKNSPFESMGVIKMENQIILNPQLTNKAQRYGWREIKILQNGKDYQIVSEFYGKSIKETLAIFYSIFEYSFEILKRAKS